MRPVVRLLYRVEIVGRVPTGAVVVAANHESVLDPPLLTLTAEQPLHFLAKAELWRYPPGAWLMDALGGIPISRDRRDRDALRRGLELLEAGEAVAIFPEGTVQGGVWTRGAARLALSAGVPLVPVRIIDSGRALSRRRVGFPRIRLVIGEPIPVDRAKPTVEEARDLTKRVVASIHRLS